jgi:hypothetical protein
VTRPMHHESGTAPGVPPMSDRRAVVLVVAALIAIGGVAVAVVALVALQQPRWRGGDLGQEVDAGGPLTAALALGLLLVAAAAATVTGLVRAQLRRRGGEGSERRDGGRIVP